MRRNFPKPALLAALALSLLAAGCAEEVDPRHYVAGGDPARGRVAVVRYGCPSCHTIPGLASADGIVGPTLERFAARVYIAGSLPNLPGSLVAWLRDPPALKPNTAMPDLHVSEGDARDMAAFLYTLGPVVPPYPAVERRASVPPEERQALEMRNAARLAGIEEAMARVAAQLSGADGSARQHPGE